MHPFLFLSSGKRKNLEGGDKVESKRYELVIRGRRGEGKVEEFARVIRRVNSLRWPVQSEYAQTHKRVGESTKRDTGFPAR